LIFHSATDFPLSALEHLPSTVMILLKLSEMLTLGNVALNYSADNKRIFLRWTHVGEYFTNPGNTNIYPGHDVFTLGGAWDVTGALKLSLRVDNLLDTRYADRADFAFGNERFFPGRPRTAFAGLTLSLD